MGVDPLVLIVDDAEDMRDLYTCYLRFAGLKSTTAASGEEAIVRARGLRPDVIVMDLMMPGIGGIEAIRALKADDATKNIPVIALTADHREETRAAAISACCDRFMKKPCLPEALVSTIREVVAA